MNKFIIISGCSGGGKSTLISELSNQGYAAVEEVGRKIVKEQTQNNGGITPWERPDEFCELLISKSIDAYYQAKEMKNVKENIIFFDRSFLEGVSFFQTLNKHEYDHLIYELRYYQTIFMAPPWQEIFIQDDERRHSFEKGVEEYNRLLKFYSQYGYSIIELPKIGIKERINFMLSNITSRN